MSDRPIQAPAKEATIPGLGLWAPAILALLILTLPVAFWNQMNYWPMMREAGFFGLAFKWGILLSLPPSAWMLWRAARTDDETEVFDALKAAAGLPGLLFFALWIGWLPWINGALDGEPERTTRHVVLDKRSVPGIAKYSSFPGVGFEISSQPRLIGMARVTKAEHAIAQPGRSQVDVTWRPGRLGRRWGVSAKLVPQESVAPTPKPEKPPDWRDFP